MATWSEIKAKRQGKASASSSTKTWEDIKKSRGYTPIEKRDYADLHRERQKQQPNRDEAPSTDNKGLNFDDLRRTNINREIAGASSTFPLDRQKESLVNRPGIQTQGDLFSSTILNNEIKKPNTRNIIEEKLSQTAPYPIKSLRDLSNLPNMSIEEQKRILKAGREQADHVNFDTGKFVTGIIKDAATDIVTDPIGTLDRLQYSQPVKDYVAGSGDFARNIINTVEAFGGDKVPGLNSALDYVKEETNRMSAQAGTSFWSKVMRSAPQSVNNLVLALASGGASIPAQLGGNAMLQGVKNIVTSPTFASTMVQTFGGSYGDAIDDGQDRVTAITRALIQSVPESLIEHAGGIETIVKKLEDKTFGLIGTALQSALEEGLEEILQYPLDALSKKATYAPETPWYSTTDNAVINPGQMLESGAVGGVAGGLFGGGTKLVSDVKAEMQQPRIDGKGQAPSVLNNLANQMAEQVIPMPESKKITVNKVTTMRSEPKIDKTYRQQYNNIDDIKTQISKYYNNVPGAKKELIDSGAEAIADLQKIENLHRGIPKELTGAKNDLRGDNGALQNQKPYKTVGKAFSNDLIDTGKINLSGITFNNTKDLAVLSQVYRDPRFETLRMIYTKGDSIVGTDAITSRMPGSAVAFLGGNRSQYFGQISDRMKRIQADGYYMLHNHPGKTTTPSRADLGVTQIYAKSLPGFKGHLIINSNKYTEIYQDAGFLKGNEDIPLSLGDDILYNPSIEHPLINKKIESSMKLAQIAKQVQLDNDVSIAFFTDVKNTVKGILEINNSMIKNSEKDNFRNFLRNQATELGGSRVLMVGKKDIKAELTELIKNGDVTDGIIESESGAISNSLSFVRNQDLEDLWMGKDAGKGKALKPAKPSETIYKKPELKIPPTTITIKKQTIKPESIKAITGHEDVLPETKPIGDVPDQFKGDAVPELDLKSERGAITLPGKKEQRAASGYKGFADSEMEERHQKSRLRPETIPQKIANFASEVKLMATRTFPLIDASLKKNAVFMQEAVRFPKIRRMAGGEAARIIRDITLRENLELNADDFNIFERVVFMRDLLEDDSRGFVLPNGWNSESLKAEWDNIQPYINDRIKSALDRRADHLNKVKNKYIEAFKSIGYDVSEKFTRENYFRHQVLEYMQIKQAASSGSYPDHVSKNRGWSKSREGTTKDINTDYLQAEYEVLFGMLNDASLAEMWRRIYDQYDIRAEVEAQAEADNKNWRQSIPDGYTIHQPFQGNYMFSATTIPEQILDIALEKGAKELNIPVDKVRHAMAVGSKRMEYVIPKEYVQTMQRYYDEFAKEGNVFDKGSRYLMGQWKRTVLTRIPSKVVKYNIRNLSGDVEAAVRAFGYKTAFNATRLSKKAAFELWEALRYHKFSPELLQFRDLGGLDDNLFVQEIVMISRSKTFKDLTGIKNRNFLQAWDEFSADMTEYRENMVRYATYLAVKNDLSKSPDGLPSNYGASLKGRIEGLRSIEERAYQMTNDAIGNYSEVTRLGRWLRAHLFPFWSFKERNFVSFARTIRNAALEITEADGQKIAKSIGLTAKVSGKAAVVIGRTTFRLFGLSLALSLLNMLNPNDDELPDDIRSSPHLTLWKGADGQVRYFSRLGVMTDILEWFGLDSLPADLKDLKEEKTNLEEVGLNMLKSPLNVAYSMLTPFLKTPFIELPSGKTGYPDVFTPRAIRDYWEYAANLVGITNEYRHLAGKPVREKYLSSIQDAFLYRSDPEETAYYKSLDLKRQFQKQVLKEEPASGFTPSDRSNALYYYKLALKYKDEKAAKKYFKEYVKLVTEDAKREMETSGKAVDINKKIVQGISKSLNTMSPIYGLSEMELAAYLNWLQPKDREAVKKGMQYYSKVMGSGQ